MSLARVAPVLEAKFFPTQIAFQAFLGAFPVPNLWRSRLCARGLLLEEECLFPRVFVGDLVAAFRIFPEVPARDSKSGAWVPPLSKLGPEYPPFVRCSISFLCVSPPRSWNQI